MARSDDTRKTTRGGWGRGVRGIHGRSQFVWLGPNMAHSHSHLRLITWYCFVIFVSLFVADFVWIVIIARKYRAGLSYLPEDSVLPEGG